MHGQQVDLKSSQFFALDSPSPNALRVHVPRNPGPDFGGEVHRSLESASDFSPTRRSEISSCCRVHRPKRRSILVKSRRSILTFTPNGIFRAAQVDTPAAA